MFTGIVEKKAEILERDGGRFTVERVLEWDLEIGQSIAHDGACMTLETISQKSYTFFVMEESLRCTNLWEKKAWDMFNVERCVLVWSRIDGHFVSGHVDCVWKCEKIEKREDGSHFIFISYPKEFAKLVISKGSITVNGVSLTVVDNEPWKFSISIIPHTWNETNLWTLKEWDTINLEFDMLGKYILNAHNVS